MMSGSGTGWVWRGGEGRNENVSWLGDDIQELIADVTIVKDEMDTVESLP